MSRAFAECPELSAAEIENLVAYLRTLRGGPALPVPRKREIARVTENLAWLTRADRDGDERPETLLDALQIPAGATVIDLGAGAGYFTWRLSRRVGPRKVIAVDVQREMLDLIAKRNLANVELALGGERGSGLPEGVADLVLIANAYHEFSEPEAMLRAVRRALKPGGRLVVLEYARRIPVSRFRICTR